MSLERDLKEAFARHEDDVRAAPGSWEPIERRITRRYRTRALGSALAVAAGIAAVAVVTPKLLTDEPPGGFAGPASESPLPAPTADWTPRVGVEDTFTLRTPPTWKGGWSEVVGGWSFEPKGLPSRAESGDTFAVIVYLEHGVAYNAPRAFESDPGFDPGGFEQTQVNGRSAFRAGETREIPGRGPRPGRWGLFLIDWPQCSSTVEQPPDERCHLRVELFGSTDTLWNKHLGTGESIVQTVDYYDGSEPVHGAFEEDTPVDDHSRALARFMDARIEGVGTAAVMTLDAEKAYGERLYGIDRRRYTNWEMRNREGVDANSVEFEVAIGFEQDPDEKLVLILETIGLGPGENRYGRRLPAVVRFGRVIE